MATLVQERRILFGSSIAAGKKRNYSLLASDEGNHG
jgi:hypothetical protein